jgi:hypothetical protein
MASRWQAMGLRDELCASKSIPPILRNDNFLLIYVICKIEQGAAKKPAIPEF